MTNLNIVVAGKAGVGKSSLLNYLVGKEIFETGVGLPVTKEYFDIHNYVDPLTKISYNLFDTKGIEPDSTEEFENELSNKIIQCRSNNNYFEQIHTIYYCLSAGSKRIEPYEVQFLKKMNDMIHLVIVLTKCDQVNNVELKELIDELKKQLEISKDEDENTISIINVCSVTIETRKGLSEIFGRQKVLDESFTGLWNTFVKDYPKHIFELALGDINTSKFKTYLIMRNLKINVFPIIATSFNQNIDLSTLNYLQLLDLPSEEFISEMKPFHLKYLLDLSKKGKELLLSRSGKNYHEKFKLDLENTIHEILEFYKKLTGKTITNKIKLTKSLAKIKEIESILLEKAPQTLLPYLNDLETKVENFRQSDWFNSKEKKEIISSYDTVVKESGYLFRHLVHTINSFQQICNAELNMFGKIVLKIDEVQLEDYAGFMAIDSYNDLNFEERKYYKAIDDNPSTIADNQDIRIKLEFLRKYLPISTKRAGQIEDFYRRDIPNSQGNKITEKTDVEFTKEQEYAEKYSLFMEDGFIDKDERIQLNHFRNKLSISIERIYDLEVSNNNQNF